MCLLRGSEFVHPAFIAIPIAAPLELLEPPFPCSLLPESVAYRLHPLSLVSRHGNQGEMNRASKGQLEAEFGTSRDDDVMKMILQQGTIIESESKEGKGNRNVANSGGSARD